MHVKVERLYFTKRMCLWEKPADVNAYALKGTHF